MADTDEAACAAAVAWPPGGGGTRSKLVAVRQDSRWRRLLIELSVDEDGLDESCCSHCGCCGDGRDGLETTTSASCRQQQGLNADTLDNPRRFKPSRISRIVCTQLTSRFQESACLQNQVATFLQQWAKKSYPWTNWFTFVYWFHHQYTITRMIDFHIKRLWQTCIHEPYISPEPDRKHSTKRENHHEQN